MAATAVNVIENAAALHLIAGGATRPWFRVVVVSTIGRFVTLWGAFVLGALALATAPRAPRA